MHGWQQIFSKNGSTARSLSRYIYHPIRLLIRSGNVRLFDYLFTMNLLCLLGKFWSHVAFASYDVATLVLWVSYFISMPMASELKTQWKRGNVFYTACKCHTISWFDLCIIVVIVIQYRSDRLPLKIICRPKQFSSSITVLHMDQTPSRLKVLMVKSSRFSYHLMWHRSYNLWIKGR